MQRKRGVGQKLTHPSGRKGGSIFDPPPVIGLPIVDMEDSELIEGLQVDQI